MDNNRFEALDALQIWEMLYNKELNCKKNILEYIEITQLLKKENASNEQLRETYNFIYQQIERMKDSIKPNTMLFLKNTLKAQLGKYTKDKDPKPVNHFVEFFKEAYPENNRRKDFTWVLMDIDNITDEQIWTTLVYINRRCMNHGLLLNGAQEKDIIKMIKKVVNKNDIKIISNLKTLSQLLGVLEISIVSVGEGGAFRVKHAKA